MRCNGCDEQTIFGDCYLIDQYPCGKGKQWRSFHHHLVSQAKRESRGFFWKGLYHYREKFCPASRRYAPNRAMSQSTSVLKEDLKACTPEMLQHELGGKCPTK
jgi:hypothetical protein